MPSGNFAAHPMKSQLTGLILDVEPGEAEWTLDVLEELFDFYFVLPAVIQKKKDAFNKKLQDAGKPTDQVNLCHSPASSTGFCFGMRRSTLRCWGAW